LRILLVSEDREGALVRSLEVGLRDLCHEVWVVDPAPHTTRTAHRRSITARASRLVTLRSSGARLVEAVKQLRPDVTLLVKGRGIGPEWVRRSKALSRVAIYYPDNPFWRAADTHDALPRLAMADLAVVWSSRIRDLLTPTCQRVAVVPFGYDEHWFPLTDPGTPRAGVAFVGTWNPRRERYLRALEGLPTTIVGSGWEGARSLRTAPSIHGPNAGSLLQRAAIGVNIYHPQNAGAHNMRTRELAASGALQLTDPGTDGTPLRDGDGCRWFHSPDHLRRLVEHYLARSDEARTIARRAQELVGHETYRHRAQQVADLFGRLA
jgi:spore maturation protein CgeB